MKNKSNKSSINNDNRIRKKVMKELAQFDSDMDLYASIKRKLSAKSKTQPDEIITIQIIRRKRIKDMNREEDRMFRRHEDYYLKYLLEKGLYQELDQEKREVRLKRKIRKLYGQAFKLMEIDGTIYFVFHDENAFQELIKVCNELVRIARNPLEIRKEIRLYQQLREELPHPGDNEYRDWEMVRATR